MSGGRADVAAATGRSEERAGEETEFAGAAVYLIVIVGDARRVGEIFPGDGDGEFDAGAGTFFADDVGCCGFFGFECEEGFVGGADGGGIEPEEKGDVGARGGVGVRIR